MDLNNTKQSYFWNEIVSLLMLLQISIYIVRSATKAEYVLCL